MGPLDLGTWVPLTFDSKLRKSAVAPECQLITAPPKAAGPSKGVSGCQTRVPEAENRPTSLSRSRRTWETKFPVSELNQGRMDFAGHLDPRPAWHRITTWNWTWTWNGCWGECRDRPDDLCMFVSGRLAGLARLPSSAGGRLVAHWAGTSAAGWAIGAFRRAD